MRTRTSTAHRTIVVLTSATSNTCRVRKVKCDEALPACQRCRKAHRYCDRTAPLPQLKKSQEDTAEPDSAADEPQTPFPSPSSPRKALQNPSIARYFSHYIADIAPWYDLSDALLTFATSLPEAALDSPLPFAAILALSAVHTSRTTVPSARAAAEFYHGHCVRLLIDLTAEEYDNDERTQGLALASVCLLRSYEILSEEVDPNRHLQGAYSLAAYHTPQTDAFGSSLRAAGFWNYLREDITFSLFRRCPLKIDLAQVPLALPATGPRTDQDYLNAITLILGRIINMCFVGSGSVTKESWSSLSHLLREWRTSLPSRFEPFSTVDRGLGLALPSIWLLRDHHAAALHYQLVATTILCIEANPQQLSSLQTTLGGRLDLQDTKESILEHLALDICGVAFTADTPSVQVNAFGPIAFCARFIRTEASRQELIRRLLACKRTIGWPVQRLVSDLEADWRNPPPPKQADNE
ncbi:phytanoyl- dioxygenase [Colletotrichum scovillei]|uniref:Phytanoyl- dioxygenase n=1 Tax=Colletotrichum scovillei TaxID=1209932 RepID=A0A9P7RAQ0_9PEZI|nr:phytanoyl- dioxygenase [Colletotrichum scovillei]KAG7072223.1 phytanoyl- dioxygenase [Colletotrichum scovillei]KAG7080335.1 phytanoyl- dioxygenase [Colletotrichum scovillei]